jgi:hypothetical protein
MGYCMTQRDSNFAIKAEDKEKALEAIKELAGKETIHDGSGKHFAWVGTEVFVNASTLNEAMDEWRWEIVEDEDGNVLDIYFSGEKLGDDKILFDAIAPYVKEGSYIEMSGEDGYLWRWSFDGKSCVELSMEMEF